MAKLLLRAGIWLHAGLGLAVAALPFCVPVAAFGQDPGFFALLSASKKAAQPPPAFHSTQPPTFSVPVESLGFTAPGQFYLGMRNSLVSLDFLDENRVLFTFRVPGLIHRNFAAGDDDNERQIRALVLQLPEGTVLAEALWTLHDRSRYLYPIGNGQFLLRDRDNLLLGDASLQVKPYLHFPGPVLWLELDPTRQFLVTGSSEESGDEGNRGESGSTAAAAANVPGEEKRPGQPDVVLRILRRDSGKVILVTHVRSAVHLPINSDGYLETLRSKGMAWMLNLNHFDGGSTIVGSIDSVCSPMLDFVSPKEVLATTCTPNGDPRLVAMSTSGRHLWDDPESGWSVWPLLIMSPDGSRVARETLVSSHSVNSSAPLGTDDIKGQAVEVFDAANGKIALRTQASPIFDAGGNVAISPSGKRVAVLVAGAIQVFDLPAAPALADPAVTQAGR